MIVAEGQIPGLRETIVDLGGLALSAGGAAAINMWFDRDIDGIMSRTKGRPIPSGLVSPAQALTFGLVLGAASVVVLGVFDNGLAAALAAAGYVYYAVVYTMLLKRRTPQNIVIGGGAGAFPPLVGWAAVTGHLSLAAILMFAVIFFWTPAHFWGLALYKNEDYVKVGVPMMPAVRGAATTKRQMIAYSLVLLVVSLTLGVASSVGMLYDIAAIVLGLLFVVCNLRLWREPHDQHTWAKRTFLASLLYLPAVFTAMAVGALL